MPMGRFRLICSAQLVTESQRSTTVKVRRSAEGSGNEGGSVKLTQIELHDKLKALDMLARHLGMYRISERRSRR
jgi:hypothetical protein